MTIYSSTPSKTPEGYNITKVSKKYFVSSFQNSRNDRDILLPRQSPKVFLYHWGIHLRPSGPQYPADFSMKQEILKTVQSLSSVSCRMSYRLFHESETLKDHLIFRQVQQSSLCEYFMSSLCNSPGKISFLPKWLTKFIRSLFNAHLPQEVVWCCQEQTCLIVMKSTKLLKHFKGPNLQSLKDMKCAFLTEIYLYISRKTN